MEQDERERAAVHESGHAIAALRLGIPVLSVSCIRNGRFAGECVAERNRAPIRDQVVYIAAGPMAEQHYFDSPHGCVFANDWEATEELLRDYAFPYVTGCRHIDRHYFLRSCYGTAVELVRQNELSIQWLAEALLDCGAVDGNAIKALLRQRGAIL